MELHREQLVDAGLEPVVIAQGEPKHAERYCGKFAPNITCLCRDDTEAYRVYGLRQGSLREFASLDVLKAGARAFRQGHVGGQVVGDARMMPGTFIIDTDGIVQYAYYSQHAGDHPDIDDLISEAQALRTD